MGVSRLRLKQNILAVIKRLAICGVKHIGCMHRPEGQVRKFVFLLTGGGGDHKMSDMYINLVSNYVILTFRGPCIMIYIFL